MLIRSRRGANSSQDESGVISHYLVDTADITLISPAVTFRRLARFVIKAQL